MNKITTATRKSPIDIEITVKQDKKVNTKKLKIYGIVDAHNRMNELDTIPELSAGGNDNWLISKMICNKDNGRLPTASELAIIAGLQEEKLINTGYYGNFWANSECSLTTATTRSIFDDSNNEYEGSRWYGSITLCVGD